MRQPPSVPKLEIEEFLIPLIILDIRKVAGRSTVGRWNEQSEHSSEFEAYCVLRDPNSAQVYKEWIDPVLITKTQLRALLDAYCKSWEDLKTRDSAFLSFSRNCPTHLGEKLAEAEGFKESFGLLPKKKRAASSSVGRNESKHDGRFVAEHRQYLNVHAPAMKQRMSKRIANKRVTMLKYKASPRVAKQMKDLGRQRYLSRCQNFCPLSSWRQTEIECHVQRYPHKTTAQSLPQQTTRAQKGACWVAPLV